MTVLLSTTEVDVKSLPPEIQDVISKHESAEGFLRKSIITKEEDFGLEEGSRTAVRYVSTGDVDRDSEILLPEGAILSEFRKAPQVLWGHNYRLPPIGKDLWIKRTAKGILAKTQFATTAMAEEIWLLVKDKFLRTSSVGFLTLKAIRNGQEGWDKLCDRLLTAGYKFDREKVGRIFTKWILLEHSDVSVPANINALTVAVAKGMSISESLFESLGIDPQEIEKVKKSFEVISTPPPAKEIETKGVIPYRDLGVAPEAEAWNGPREVAAADVNALKLMGTWFDSEHADIKGAYKLPHHKASGAHVAVWRGVSASMVVLFGGRGGVNVPARDRRGIYNHLASHYRQWDKEPPEFRDYSDAELKELLKSESWLGDAVEDLSWLHECLTNDWDWLESDAALKPFPNEHSCRLHPPGGYSRFARRNDAFGSGIHAIFGRKKTDGKSELQAIRFDRTKFTVAQAKKWAKDHDHTCILFERATGETRSHVEPLKEPSTVVPIEDKKEVIKVVPTVVPIKQTIVKLLPDPVVEEEEPLHKQVVRSIGRAQGKV